MRISDWSSDVCSSDLTPTFPSSGRSTVADKLKVLDLFSGIGGFSLGLERTGGFETVAFCEIEEFPRRVLKKHWPEVPCYHDVRELTADRLAADGIADIDVIAGGFPCQDISIAGRGLGLSRSEEHTSELQSLMRISYAVFCLKKTNNDSHHLLHI